MALGPRGWNLRVIGLERTQAKLLRVIQAEAEAWGAADDYIIPEILTYARNVTHVWSGYLRASHTVDQRLSRQRGTGLFGGHVMKANIHIREDVMNVLVNKRPADYGVVEHGRGGAHAFYARTYEAFKDRVGARFVQFMMKGMPGGD